MENNFDIPNWAGKPKDGLHLAVSREDVFLFKLMIDTKRCYLFGRKPELNDFTLDHVSCSRLHAALTYHKHLNLSYLTDLGSTHGTFVGNMKIEPYKPTVIRPGTFFCFGASSRRYTLREGISCNTPKKQQEVDPVAQDQTVAPMDTLKQEDNQTTDVHKAGTKDTGAKNGRCRNLVESTFVPAKRLCFESTLPTNQPRAANSDFKPFSPSSSLNSAHETNESNK